MNMKLKQLLLATAALAVLALAPAAVKADAILVVQNPVVTVSQGGSAPLIAQITNSSTTNTLTLNQLDITFTGPDGITFDKAPFFEPTFPFVLGPGESTGFVPFFNVMADFTVLGPYPGGSFTVQFGCDPGCTEPDATGDFSVFVQAGAPSDVPEPATMFLLATGLGGAALARRRAKKKGKIETSS